MADDKRISELPLATTPLAGTEEQEIIQGGVNKRVAVSNVGGGGSVTSVSGTTDRITSTGGTTPVINISATFEALLQKLINTAVAITDAASMDLTSIKHTLTTASATRTFTISYTGDCINMKVILNAVGSVFTFPAGAKCISDGTPSGDNTCTLDGASGDEYIFAIYNWGGGAYTVIAKNQGQ